MPGGTTAMPVPKSGSRRARDRSQPNRFKDRTGLYGQPPGKSTRPLPGAASAITGDELFITRP